MRLNVRAVSASATVLALMAPLAAGAADPASAVLAQTSRLTTPERNTGPSLPTGPEGVSPRPGSNTTGDLTLEEPSVPTSPPPRIGLFPEFGASLLNRGIDFHGIAFDHFLANPTAGVQPGHTSNLGAFRPAVDLDLERLVGIPGGTIHASMTFFGLTSDLPQIITQTGGFLTGFQTLPVVQTNILSLLTYEQKLLGGRLSLEAGRTNAYNYFLLPNSLDPFTNFSSAFEIDGDFPSPPYPNWGGRATYKLTPTWYVQGGGFEDNYHTALNSNPFSTTLSPGVQFLAEIGQRSEFSNAAYPSNFEAGVEWNTRNGRANLKGTGAPALPLLQRTNYSGGGVFFTQGLQTIWRGAKRDVGPPPNIALYGSFDTALQTPQPISLDAIAGVNFTGLIPGRPFDAVGLQAHYQKLSAAEVQSETFRQRIIDGPGPRQRSSNYAYEIVGNIQVTPAIAFRPIVEYFVKPDNYYPPAPGRNMRPHDGWEAGFFAVVSLGRLLGTSLKPF